VSTHKGSLAKMHIMGDIMAVSKNACSIMTVSWISIIIVGRIYDFHVAYISFIEQTKSEEWLLEHCQDDHFFHKMAYHTDVCALVMGNSIIWPSLHGINESMGKMKLCGLYDCSTLFSIVYSGGFPVLLCIFLLYIVTPSFILPLLQRMYYIYHENALMNKCSPSLRNSSYNKKHAMYNDRLSPPQSPSSKGRVKLV